MSSSSHATATCCTRFVNNSRRRLGRACRSTASPPTLPARSRVATPCATLAEELRDHRIDVNSIAPGALNTRLLDEVLAAGPDRVGRAFFERSQKQRDDGGAPLEKGAALAVFLASAASDGITGRLLSAVWDKWADLAAKREQLAKSDVYTLRRIAPEDRGMQW